MVIKKYDECTKIPEAWRQMYGQIPVTLLKTVVLLHVVKVIPSHDNGSLHLQLSNDASKDSSSNGHISSEWAFLVNVGPIDGLQ